MVPGPALLSFLVLIGVYAGVQQTGAPEFSGSVAGMADAGPERLFRTDGKTDMGLEDNP